MKLIKGSEVLSKYWRQSNLI